MAGFIGGRTSAFDYIDPELPNNPQNGEMWFDTDGASDGSGEVKVYDAESGAWEPTGFTSHADLTDVTRSAHHPPVEVSGPLTQPADQSLGLSIGDGLADDAGTLVAALGNGLGIDGSGQVYVPASAVSQSMLAFETATQGELDGHANDTANPHNVTDDQTGAASALSNHAVDASAHHTRYSDAEASAAAPVQDVNGQTGSVNLNTSPSATLVSLSAGASLGVGSAGTDTGSDSHTSASAYTVVHASVDLSGTSYSDSQNGTIDGGGWEYQGGNASLPDILGGNSGATTQLSISASVSKSSTAGSCSTNVEVIAFAIE